LRRTRKRKPRRAAEHRAAERGPRLTAFPPLLGANPRLLILGSLPGAQSLAAREYYAHPRNLFWDLMGELFGAGRDLPYAERVARLTGAGVAVWDVLHQAHRPGSLDASIHPDTLVPNDFDALFAAQPQLRTVAFNGGTVATLFRRHVLPTLRDTGRLTFLTLPSTSPAHAARTRAQKLALWSAVKGAGE
jgi:hypoxanthine-DNA glycosylase